MLGEATSSGTFKLFAETEGPVYSPVCSKGVSEPLCTTGQNIFLNGIVQMSGT